jgi:CHAD domain-containing protein
MVFTTSPSTLFAQQINRLTVQLDGVRDGGADSIHDARVTTRRLRELLELANNPVAADLHDRVRAAGRALGAVRDVDVRIGLLTRMEHRLPPMAPALFSVRLDAERMRPPLLRKTVKRLEKLDLPSTIDAFDRSALRSARLGRWSTAIRRALVERARAMRAAVEHAAGIYFPNRMHALRIALKQLRYAMEIATATRTVDFSAHLRDLRSVQGVLGDLHDRQMLRDHLASVGTDAAPGRDAIAAIDAVIDAGIRRRHGRYLSKRAGLLHLSRSIEATGLHHRWRLLPVVTTGAVAIASGLYLESAYRSSNGRPA